jgi:hypothetical protein
LLPGLVRHEARHALASAWPIAHPPFCALDLVRLVGSLVRDGGSAEPLTGSPFDVAELVASEARHWFADDIAALGELLIERLPTDRTA